jgi:hypothetical protein
LVLDHAGWLSTAVVAGVLVTFAFPVPSAFMTQMSPSAVA